VVVAMPMPRIPIEEIDPYLHHEKAPIVEQISLPRDLPSWWAKERASTPERVGELVQSEWAYTFQSLRENARPQTILHALISEDRLSRAEIAAIIGTDPVDAGFRETLSALEEVRVVHGFREDEVVRYVLTTPDGVGPRAYLTFDELS
jgi:hypothetical protein